MTPDRSQELFAAEIAADLLDLPPQARETALAALPHTLADRVRAMIRCHDLAPGFLDDPLISEHSAEDHDYGLPAGVSVGRYRLVRLLGRGGMADVYEALQPGLNGADRPVALKLLRPGQRPAEVSRRFRREVSTIAALDHPGICKLLDTGVFSTDEGPREFCVLELIHGRPITEHANERGLDVRERLRLFLHVCDAIEHAHFSGVMHRDIKPANILISADGRPKVLDFGIARILHETTDSVTATGPGGPLGTPGYMSPEQLLPGPAKVDLRTDVYSLGAVLYELLAGRPPHDPTAESLPAFARRVTEEDPPPLSRFGPHLKGDLSAIVAAALRRDRDKRYPTVQALAGDIRAFLESRPISARANDTRYVLYRFLRRHRAVCAVAAVALLSIVVGGAGFAWQAAAARKAASEARAAAALADVRTEHLQKIANAVIDDLYLSVMSIPGSTKSLRIILDQIAGKLDEVYLTGRSDPDLRAVIIETYRRLATVVGSPGHPGDFKFDEARLLLTRIKSMAQSMCSEFPDHLGARLALSNILFSEAFLFSNAADIVAGLRESLALRRSVFGVNPDHPKCLNSLAHVLHCLGKFLPPSAAEPLIAESIDLFSLLVARHPDDPGWLVSLGIAHHEMSRVLAADTASSSFFADQASACLDAARDIHLARGEDPFNFDSISRHRAGCFIVQARVLWALQDPQAARLACGRALDLVDRSFMADPNNLMRRRDLGRILTEAAHLHLVIARRSAQPDPWLSEARLLSDRACIVLALFERGPSTPHELMQDLLASLEVADAIDGEQNATSTGP
ncbi:MAG: serine/threonine protein kinase [Phycisphaerae bacterium]|nr:serine/threonine protein kinase [Phycisphaerae bacterium]